MSCKLGSSYIFKAGDTLSNIAQEKLGDGTRWRELMKSDGSPFTDREAQQLQVGQEVCVPLGSPVNLPPQTSCPTGTQSYVVKAGDTLYLIAEQKLGDGNRWHDFQKSDGTPFTETDAEKLQVGQQICIPG